jgi:hypothetical protein
MRTYMVCLAASCLQLAFVQNAFPQRAIVTWVPAQTGQPLPGNLLWGGKDYDQNKNLYICRVSLAGGVHPGKLLNNNCNVSYAGSGTEYHQFEVATISGGSGHWGPWNPPAAADILLGGHEASGAPLYVCHANYIVHGGVIGPLGSKDTDHGPHPGKLVAGKCDLEWGGKEIAEDQYVQVFYLTPPPVPPPTKNPPTQPQGDVRIVPSGSCNQVGNEMVLVNSTNRLITATIRRDVNGQSQNITVPLAANQRFPLGCTVGVDSSQWSWNLLAVQ